MPSTTPGGDRKPFLVRRVWADWVQKNSLILHSLWKYRVFVTFGLLALFLVDVLDVLPPLLLKKAVDLLNAPSSASFLQNLKLIALAYLGVALLQALGRFRWRMFLIRASLRCGLDLRNLFAKKLFCKSPTDSPLSKTQTSSSASTRVA